MRFLLVALTLFCFSGPALGQSVGDSVAKFGFEYFQSMPADTNAVVSPLSIHAAFSMLALGTAGTTESQTLQVLKLKPGFAKNYSVFLESLQPEVGEFNLASRVWPDKRFQLTEEYKKLCSQAFQAAPKNLDYDNPEPARKTINDWVSQKTNGLIPELLPPKSVDSSTELVLSNALYLEAQWVNGFRPEATRPASFQTPKGKVEVPMMHGRVNGLLYEESGLQAISLLYKNCPIAMLVAMPESDLAKARGKLNKSLLNKVEMAAMKTGPSAVNLSLPKFKIKQESKPLRALKEMGMTQLLGSSPNLSRLTKDSKGLVVSDCFHEAVVEVDENGTRAAAATAITITRTGAIQVKQLTIDRPFFFVLYHRTSLAPLFIGQVTDPSK